MSVREELTDLARSRPCQVLFRLRHEEEKADVEHASGRLRVGGAL